MLEKSKIKLDYFRKSLVPFDEKNRVRFQAQPVQPLQFQDPFETVPYAGQKHEQYKISKGHDRLHTFATRVQAQRTLLQDMKKEGDHKVVMGYPRQVATDVDELYIKDLSDGAIVKSFRPATVRQLLKNSLRKKFEGWVIEQKVVEQKIAERKEEEYAYQVEKLQAMLNKLFSKWEKKEYDRSMKYVNKIKPYVEATAVYAKMYENLGRYYLFV